MPVTSKLDTLTKFLADFKLSVGKAKPTAQTDDEKFCGIGNHVAKHHLVYGESRPLEVVSHNPGPPNVESRNYVRFATELPQAQPYQFELQKAELTPFLGMVLITGDL